MIFYFFFCSQHFASELCNSQTSKFAEKPKTEIRLDIAHGSFQSVRREVGIMLFSRGLKGIEGQMSGLILNKKLRFGFGLLPLPLSGHCLTV